MARAAIKGESKIPKNGYKTLAAIGIPSTLYPRANNRLPLMSPLFYRSKVVP